MYDFDEVIDRRGHNSAKWDRRFIGEGEEALLPFWVADTDFRTATPCPPRAAPPRRPGGSGSGTALR